jgi:hypothetical protein
VYELLFATNLVDGIWNPVSLEQAGTDDLMSLSHTNAGSQGFYRIEVELP